MKKVACDGCGMGEPLDLPDKQRTIRTVKIAVSTDSRSSFPESSDHYEADLCKQCVGHLLDKYFNVLAEGQLSVPAFLEPTKRERGERLLT